MQIQIHKALKEDMPAVLDLIKELAIFENEPHAVEVTVDDLLKEGFGEDPLFTCFVAKVENEIVGMALVYFRFSTWKGRTVHLEDLVVKESMRGKNVGKALYTEVMNYGYEHGVKRIEWVVLDWNKPAIKFYENTGAKFQKNWHLVEMNEQGIKKYIDNK
ncbi:MAG: GNAT family N-acetyltransferase [Flavobacteriaceae bacterium]|nr:GNAT family N-acetyltransferase [Flavobacteriaceae bacterium]